MSIWKELQRADLSELERHSNNYEPYCHLNIIDLWAYKLTDNYWLSLGDTIAYKLNSYMDDSLYTTILGDKDLRRTIRLICDEAGSNELSLSCVPEEVVNNLGSWAAIKHVSEDHDNHDYIFDVLKMLTFSTNELRGQAKKYRRLLRNHPELGYRVLDHSVADNREQMYELFQNWVRQTGASHWQREYRALQRALSLPNSRLVCLGFFDGNNMVGYTVNRAEKNGYYQAYFGKADRRYNPLSLYQEYSTADYMHKTYGSLYMNLQPDSGIDGLRKYKTSLGPSRKLKKYDVVIDTKKI